MLEVETSTVINRPVEEVFAVASNRENDRKWFPGAVEARKTSEGPIGVGTTWRVVIQVFGRRLESEVEFTEYEPNRKFAEKTESPFPVRSQITFESVEGGTRVSDRHEAEPAGFFKLLGPLLAIMVKRQNEAALANLKDLMEAHAL